MTKSDTVGKKRAITILDISYDHMVVAELPELVGKTVRKALATLRSEGKWIFGSRGEMTAYLSDGTTLHVELQDAHEQGCQLLSSQRICRRAPVNDRNVETLIRTYKW